MRWERACIIMHKNPVDGSAVLYKWYWSEEMLGLLWIEGGEWVGEWEREGDIVWRE